MCGIAGRYNYLSGAPVSPRMVQGMCDLIAHRGPDADGVWIDGPIGLGHRRLADDPIQQEVQQLLLVADMPVQGGGARVQLVRQPAHREALQAVALEQDEGGVDDQLAGQRALVARRLGPAAPPRGVRDIRH